MASLTIDDALQLATGHFQAGRTDAAKAALDAILGEAPDCADAHNLLGLTAHKTGALEAALTSIGEAVRLVPKDANYISNLGVVHKTRGDLGQAETCFRRAAQLEPKRRVFNSILAKPCIRMAAMRTPPGPWPVPSNCGPITSMP